VGDDLSARWTGCPVAGAALVNALIDRGDGEVARAVVDGFVVDPADASRERVLRLAHARLEVVLGQYERALERLAGWQATIERGPGSRSELAPWYQLSALALLGLGRRDEAREMIARALGPARPSPTPYSLGTALRVAALIEEPVSLGLLRRALTVLEGSEFTLEHARVLVDLGSALRRARRRREALAPLQRGRALALGCGATALISQADEELGVLESAPHRQLVDGLEALTASERRVALMAIEGLSNPEIALALFVSRKAVEKHLGNCYLKLNISSRHGLRTALVGADSASERVARSALRSAA
jgi:DNA-binding CsgD family transcriptional regulator